MQPESAVRSLVFVRTDEDLTGVGIVSTRPLASFSIARRLS
jgi:hypothetical protein